MEDPGGRRGDSPLRERPLRAGLMADKRSGSVPVRDGSHAALSRLQLAERSDQDDVPSALDFAECFVTLMLQQRDRCVRLLLGG